MKFWENAFWAPRWSRTSPAGPPGQPGWLALPGWSLGRLAGQAGVLAGQERPQKEECRPQPAGLPGCLPFCLPVRLAGWLQQIWLSVCLSVGLSIWCLSDSLSPCPSVCLSVGLPACLPIRPSVRPSVRVSVCLPACLSPGQPGWPCLAGIPPGPGAAATRIPPPRSYHRRWVMWYSTFQFNF